MMHCCQILLMNSVKAQTCKHCMCVKSNKNRSNHYKNAYHNQRKCILLINNNNCMIS